MIFKYIMLENGPVIISPSLSHASVEIKEEIPISAGFVRFYINAFGSLVVECYGESESLGLASRPEDTDMFMVFGKLLTK